MTGVQTCALPISIIFCIFNFLNTFAYLVVVDHVLDRLLGDAMTILLATFPCIPRPISLRFLNLDGISVLLCCLYIILHFPKADIGVVDNDERQPFLHCGDCPL